MNTIWFLSKERNLLICGFNRIEKQDGTTELWVKEVDGGSRKIATGKEAIPINNNRWSRKVRYKYKYTG